MSNNAIRDLVQQFVAGELSRRDFMARAAALGLSTSAIGPLLAASGAPAAAQDDPLASWPPPPYIPEPDTEILLPIDAPLTEETVTFRLLNNDFGYVTDFEDNRVHAMVGRKDQRPHRVGAGAGGRGRRASST